MYEMLCEVVSMCVKITNESKADCFFNYSGHVNIFDIQCYPDGYVGNMSHDEFDKTFVAYCKKLTQENLIVASQKLREIASSLGVEL